MAKIIAIVIMFIAYYQEKSMIKLYLHLNDNFSIDVENEKGNRESFFVNELISFSHIAEKWKVSSIGS